ncbi:MAG TPA: hypothetical protein VMO75_00695, partial [Chthoniobacterales bacterium]|nr:hypothetical protein [Chthoniobacterales bacterium]
FSRLFFANETYKEYAMSLSVSIPKTSEQTPLENLLALTRTALGLGVGMLVADKIGRPARQATAIALMSVGALAAVPFLVKVALARINRPESDRGSRARLRSIRGDSGYRSEVDIY